MSRHQQEVEPAAPPGCPAGYGNSDFSFWGDAQGRTCQVISLFYFLFKASYGILHSPRVAGAWESMGPCGQRISRWPHQPSEPTTHQLG